MPGITIIAVLERHLSGVVRVPCALLNDDFVHQSFVSKEYLEVTIFGKSWTSGEWSPCLKIFISLHISAKKKLYQRDCMNSKLTVRLLYNELIIAQRHKPELPLYLPCEGGRAGSFSMEPSNWQSSMCPLAIPRGSSQTVVDKYVDFLHVV